jgi:hypothetical protein
MMVILLAGTTREAASYARAASLRMGEFVYAATPQQLDGIHLGDGDLIAEFHSFRHHPMREQIEDALLRKVAGGKTKPKWARIGQ